MRPIGSFDELVSALEELIQAAESVDGELAHSLRSLERRVKSIRSAWQASEADGGAESAPSAPPTDEEAIFQRLDQVVEATERGELSPELTNYLRSAALRLLRVHEGAEDLRLAPRRRKTETARLEIGDQFHEVRILDRSVLGFGVQASVPAEPDDFVRLVVEDEFGATVYDCLVIHCRPDNGGYILGLDIFGHPRSGGT